MFDKCLKQIVSLQIIKIHSLIFSGIYSVMFHGVVERHSRRKERLSKA